MALGLSCACRDEASSATEPEPIAPLPSAAKNAVGPYLPTARGAGPRIITTTPNPSEQLDGGSFSSGEGVPL